MKPTPKAPQPSRATRAALVALLRTDPGVTPAHRARILATFDAPDRARVSGWLPVSVVAADLGLTLSTLLRWCESGKVQSRREGERITLVDKAEVAAHAAAHPPRHRRQPPAGGSCP